MTTLALSEPKPQPHPAVRCALPPRAEMLAAMRQRDRSYEGVFFTAVQSTGIFCRPGCPARTPRADNVEFYATARDALLAGYRACKRCRPLEPAGSAPAWLAELLAAVEADPTRRWTDADLRQRGLGPDQVRRWFQRAYGMTFHAYQRARRLGLALGQIRCGGDVTGAAFDHGYDSLSGFNEAFRRLFGEAPTRRRAPAVTITINRILSPLGPMLAGATEEGICLLEFGDRRMLETQIRRLRSRLGATFVPGRTALLDRLVGALEGYFAGQRRRFDLPLELPGTDFQRQIWQRLLAIPCGETITYGQLAREVGRPAAIRAAARAVGDNRVGIVVPCHRVVGADGRLTGYGGGLWRKQRLLALETGRTFDR